MQDHVERKHIVLIQRQYQRFCERRKCFRFRVVANAALLRHQLKQTPGRVLGLNTWTIVEELDRVLRQYREWNPKPYYRFRSTTPDMVMRIRKKRERTMLYLHQREEEKKKKEQEALTNEKEEEERRRRNEMVSTETERKNERKTKKKSERDVEKDEQVASKKKMLQKKKEKNYDHLSKDDHHHNEKPRPMFTTILDERKFHTFAKGEIVQYKVRWRGADVYESWIDRRMMLDTSIFPPHCQDIVYKHETNITHREHQQMKTMLDSAATIIQTYIYRGCFARMLLTSARDAAILIQTFYHAKKGTLEPRREMLLAARFAAQIEREEKDRFHEMNKFNRWGGEEMNLSFVGEISSIIHDLQKDLRKENIAVDENGHVKVIKVLDGWTCNLCNYENEKELKKCDLCLKRRPAVW